MISSADKPALRARLLDLRGKAAQAKPKAGALLAETFPGDWVPETSVCIAGYWPLAGEMDPRPLMARLATAGHSICLPVVVGDGQSLEFRSWQLGDALERKALGVMEPLSHQPVCQPSLLLVPLVGCDRSGNRLGYGKGYYDHTLSALRAARAIRAIGLAFDCQMVADLPADGHDQPLDALATESRFVVF
ncbi:5-formyltetrahydrofolate cyclo-ligase [Maricaulis maris]|uniref:5-formyltetrahydrofolate cyclo-ligase n=1 Tax=Maricaulis maris TaxID=74318 RepID=UPI003B8ADB2D